MEPERITFSRQGRDFPHLKLDLLTKTPSPSLRVGYMGQITWHKGIHVLLEAARRMPDAPVIVRVYGDTAPFPEYTARLRHLIAEDKRLQLAGLYDRQELSRILQELDVIVVPSLWYENSPNVILEALACRTPVIASNLGGMAELIQHGRNGLLFEAGNASDLAAQLGRLVEEPGLLDALRRGTGPVRSMDEEISELVGIYERAVGSRVASGASSLHR